MKAVSVELKGNFGFFQWGKTRGDKRISNLFISRTDVLGILGAVIGLEGYGQRTFKEKFKVKPSQSFYEALGGLHIAIIPKVEPVYFEDHLIHRSMKHINKKGALMVYMQGIVKPHYKIIIEQNTVEDDIFNKLVTYLENGWSEFIPYLGKNQFPLEILNFQHEDLTEVNTDEEVVMNSLFKQSDAKEMPEVSELDLVDMDEDIFFYSEGLKDFSTPGKLDIVSVKTIWSSIETEMDAAVFKTNDEENITFL